MKLFKRIRAMAKRHKAPCPTTPKHNVGPKPLRRRMRTAAARYRNQK